VLGFVAADHLDHPQRHVEPLGQVDPDLAGRLHRVDRVDDHVVPDAELDLRESGHRAVRRKARPGLGDVVAPQREIDRVDGEHRRGQLGGHPGGKSALTDPGQPGEDSQHHELVTGPAGRT
jgi:hypothetical protein